MMKKISRTELIGGLAVLATIATCAKPTEEELVSAPSANAAEPSSGKLVVLARLEPLQGVIDLAAPSDDVIGTLLVSEGDRVDAGAPLAHMALHPLRKAEHDHLIKRVRTAEAQIEAAKAVGEAAIRAAELAERRTKMAELEIQIQTSRLELAQKRAQTSKLASTQHEVTEAQARLEQLKKDAEIGRLEAKNQVAAARAALAQSLSAIPIESLRAELVASQARLDKTILAAPSKGQILRIHARPGERPGLRPVLQMGDTSNMSAQAEVYQTDIRRVKPGQKVELTSPALPSALSGVVENVGVLIYKNDVFGDDPNPAKNARVFQVRIKLDSSDVAGRFTNLEVNAKIDLESGGA